MYGFLFAFYSIWLSFCIISKTRSMFCRTRSLSNATFSFLITWRPSSSKSAAVYKISSTSDDFFRWDMAIYRFSKWRPSAILELFYYRTRPPTSLLLARSCLSNFMSIWYTNLIAIWMFRIFGLKCLFRPENGFFFGGGLWTPKCDYASSRLPKGTFLRKSASFKLSTVKIRWGVWPVGELTESVTDTQTTDRHTQANLYSVHA